MIMNIGSNYVNGLWQNSNPVMDVINPSNEKVYFKIPITQKSEIIDAVNIAKSAFKTWSKESRVRRSDYFDALAQLIKRDHNKLRDAISIETGKNLNESHAEVIEALHMCQYAASSGRQSYGEVLASELPTKDAYVIRKPRGVVAIISPWNFPLAIGSFWCAAPALVEGNTVIHKPSELTPMVNQMITELYHEAGFPPGVFNLIHGDGQTTGHELVRADVDVILFTGSAEVGKNIKLHCVESEYPKTCSMECGSKSSVMVFEDGNLNLAVDVCIASAFKLTGQRCVSASRILIQKSVFDKFESMFIDKVNDLTFGDPFDTPAPMFGPLISKDHKQRVSNYNSVAEADFGLYPTSHIVPSCGYFLAPCVYKAEWGDYETLKNEVFGPHVALIPFDDIDDAIKIYNDTNYGLALGIVSDDYRKHKRVESECDTGMLYINGGSIAAESHLPFSSWKKSGWGTSAAGTYKAVTHTMAVTVNYEEGKMQFAQGMK